MLDIAIRILETERQNKLNGIQFTFSEEKYSKVREILQQQVNGIDMALNILKQFER